jgi:hypothetical protein
MCTRNSEYTVTALLVGKAEDYCSTERGRQALPENLKISRRFLRRFIHDVTNGLPRSVNSSDVLKIRAYSPEVWPRHFILKADNDIYIGSYLCHEEGSYSYLFRLSDQQEGRGLHALFLDEVKYLKLHSQPLDIEEETEAPHEI